MAVMNSALQPVIPNRRGRVRHKIQTPAYVTFTADSDGKTLDLHEIVDISEDGVAIQCHSPLAVETRVNLCLDLAECPEHIYTTGHVVWSNASGRAGLHFPELSRESLSRLRQWLFVNVMSGVANGEAQLTDLAGESPRPNYSDTLAAVTAVQRQVEAMGADLAGALRLVAEHAQTLVRASGSAVAVTEDDPDFMVCRASAGPDSPPVGARLQVGSGFSGECVKTGKLLRCDDTETDDRVDRENCRALGIRSMIAAPVRSGQKTIGILEVFSAQPNTFSASDGQVLQRFAETVLSAVKRAARAEGRTRVDAEAPVSSFVPSPGSVLFASPPQEAPGVESPEEEMATAGVSLPRSHLVILISAAAVIFLVLGYNLAPIIQSKFEERGRTPMQTVLASSQPPKTAVLHPSPGSEAVSFELMRQMAQSGDPVAENAFGLRYFEGDDKNGIVRDEKQAFRWFSRAAEHGSLSAQAKLGFLYWGGRGVAKDLNQAYFWTAVARARGDHETRDLAAILTSGMTRSQTTAIDQQADRWLQQHAAKKPAAGRSSPAGQLETSITPPR